MSDCLEVVESLSQKEKNKILSVLKKDEQIRHGQERKISQLKKEIQEIRMKAVLRAGDDQNKLCRRCRVEFGFLFNRGTLCSVCRFKVCKNCQEFMFNGSWLCIFCYKTRQLKWMTGEWATFDQNPLRKWASGSDILRASFQLYPGPSIDVDEPQQHGRTQKNARNGVAGGETTRARVDAPRDGDQHKLSQLFDVLRSKKPDPAVQQTQVRRVTSRRYHESDSESSSSSDVENEDKSGHSSPNALSVTESEKDALVGIESPRLSERSGEPTASDSGRTNQSNERVRERPQPAPRSPQPAPRKKHSDTLEPDIRVVRPKERPERKSEVIMSNTSDRLFVEDATRVSLSKSVDTNLSDTHRTDIDRNRRAVSSAEINLQKHVNKTRESLERKQEASKADTRSPTLSDRGMESQLKKGKDKRHRKSADDLLENNVRKTDEKLRKSDNHLDGEIIEETIIASRKTIDNESAILMTDYENIFDNNANKTDMNVGGPDSPQVDKQQYNIYMQNQEEDIQIQVPRGGSPYSVSMDSIPSSHPSPTFKRSSIGGSSHAESSDTDSLSRQELGEFSGTESAQHGHDEDFVVEEISKIRFQRVSKAVGKMGIASKLAKSPRTMSTDGVVAIGDRETQAANKNVGTSEAGGALHASQVISKNHGLQNQPELTVVKCSGNDICDDEVNEELLTAKKIIKPKIILYTEKGAHKADIEEREVFEQSVTATKVKKPESTLEMFLSNQSYKRRLKSADELSWFSEIEANDDWNEKQVIKPHPRHSSVVSTLDRIPSETDSIEFMIDEMVNEGPIRTVEYGRQISMPESDGSLCVTPISPFPSEKYEYNKTGTYRLAYISDDNVLDGDSDDGDDYDTQGRYHDQHVDNLQQHPTEMQNLKLDLRKSLDRLIDEQGDLAASTNLELDFEVQEALKTKTDLGKSNSSSLGSLTDIAEQELSREGMTDNLNREFSSTIANLQSLLTESDAKHHESNSMTVMKPQKTKTLIKDSNQQVEQRQIKKENSLDILLDKQRDMVKDKTENVKLDDIFNDILEDSSEIEETGTDEMDGILKNNLTVEVKTKQEKKETIERVDSKLGQKPKLTTKSSLDVLIDNQGDIIDMSDTNIELNEEFVAALEQELAAVKSVSSQDNDVHSKFTDLGTQQNITGKLHQYDSTSSYEDTEDKETLFGDRTNAGPTKLAIRVTKAIPIGYLGQKGSDESSESDGLSVIEEEDEAELVSNDDRNNEQTSPNNQVVDDQNNDLVMEKRQLFENQAKDNPVTEETDSHYINDTHLKGKIFTKARDMENKVKGLVSSQTSLHVAEKAKVRAASKQHDKFKRLQEHWVAIEHHEADILDLDNDDEEEEEEKINIQEDQKEKVPNTCSIETSRVFNKSENVENIQMKLNIDLTVKDSKYSVENKTSKIRTDEERNNNSEKYVSRSNALTYESEEVDVIINENMADVIINENMAESKPINEYKCDIKTLDEERHESACDTASSLEYECENIDDSEPEYEESEIQLQYIKPSIHLTGTSYIQPELLSESIDCHADLNVDERSINTVNYLGVSISDNLNLCKSIPDKNAFKNFEDNKPVNKSNSDTCFPIYTCRKEENKDIDSPAEDIEKESLTVCNSIAGYEYQQKDYLGASINDSSQLCRSIADRDIAEQDSLSTGYEQKDYLGASINDSSKLCRSIADRDVAEHDSLYTGYEQKDYLGTSINDSSNLCHSISDRDISEHDSLSTGYEQKDYLGASINDSSKLCHSISDRDISEHDSVSTGYEQKDYLGASINDSSKLCHSISDRDISEHDSLSSGYEQKDYLVASINDSSKLCHSISDREVSEHDSVSTGYDQKDYLGTSINDSSKLCRSIADRDVAEHDFLSTGYQQEEYLGASINDSSQLCRSIADRDVSEHDSVSTGYQQKDYLGASINDSSQLCRSIADRDIAEHDSLSTGYERKDYLGTSINDSSQLCRSIADRDVSEHDSVFTGYQQKEYLGASINDSTNLCRSISDRDINRQVNEVPEITISRVPDTSEMNTVEKEEVLAPSLNYNKETESFDHIDACITDSSSLCHSISEMRTLTHIETKPDIRLSSNFDKTEVEAVAALNSNVQTLRMCGSITEDGSSSSANSLGHGYSDYKNASITDNTSLCHSISDMTDHSIFSNDSPICESISDMSTFYGTDLDVSKTEICKKYGSLLSDDVQEEVMSESDALHKVKNERESEEVCHSIPEGDSFLLYRVSENSSVCHSIEETDISQIRTSIEYHPTAAMTKEYHESATIGSTISDVVDLGLDTVGGIEKNPESIKHGNDENVQVAKLAQNSAHDTFNPNKNTISDDMNIISEGRHIPLKRVSEMNKSKTVIGQSDLPMSSPLFKSDIELTEITDASPPLPPHTGDIPNTFKAPGNPVKVRTSQSSIPSSPDLSTSSSIIDEGGFFKSEKLGGLQETPMMITECSTSQDDSGHVSGGSRGATPEHRRTDSGYSQSSLPSTLSTVTDRSEEEEDIDKVIANIHTKPGGRGNLLSVFSDSRESIASYYSDAGDIAYSTVPVTGEILFSINYNYKTVMLEIGVKQCRNIAVADTKKNRSDPYVKTYLLPDRTRSGKRKTKIKKHTVNPTFDDTLKYSISKSELENRTLWVTMWHSDRFGRNIFLGEVTINFDYYKFDDPSPRWYELQERMDSQPSSMMVYKGDLSLCIRYVPANKVKSTQGKGKQKKEKEASKGQLEVMVKEARNLTAVRSNGFSDPFCKGYLLPERHKSSKQKTAVIKKECNPTWNHTFIFEDVSLVELRERCLELTIWDYEKLSSNDFLGGVRLNLGTGVSQGKQVDWLDARGEEMSMWQAMLDRPNLWIDGALILRPNMEKRKF